jgi:Cof subfamily protein (haloacid dehalogenase superfamily)
MENYEWCVCDLDGTLLDDNNSIQSDNVQALHKLRDQGVKLAFATGRLDLMTKKYIDQIGIETPIISCNGGLIRDSRTGEVIYSKVMDPKTSISFTEYCLENNIDFVVYTYDMVYGTRNNVRMKHYEKLNSNLYKGFEIPLQYIENGVDPLIGLDILKILIIVNDPSEVLPLQEKLMEKFPHLSIVSSLNTLIDIMAEGVTKGEALKHLAEKYNINLEKTIAFGDNYNDVTMFKEVGTPIAIGNAEEAVKKEAKYVTLTNNECGVSYAIENFILKQ